MTIDSSIVALVAIDITMLVMAVSVAVLGVGAYWWARSISAVATARASMAQASRFEREVAAGEDAQVVGGRAEAEEYVPGGPQLGFRGQGLFADDDLEWAARGGRSSIAAAEEVETVDQAAGFDPEEPPVPGTGTYSREPYARG